MSLLGERLRQAREAQGISTYQVEIDTRIRAAVIESIEQGEYEHLPPAPFLRGLIRTYTNYLRIDPDEMLGLYAADLTPPPPPPPPPIVQPTPVSEEPKKKIAPPPLMPKPSEPPEKLDAPETLEPIPTQPGRFSLAHFTRRPPSLPVIAAIVAIIFLVCLTGGLFLAISAGSFIAQLQPIVTPTRIPPTRTATPIPGAQPTAIPTIASTVLPFPTFPGNPTPTTGATPRRTGVPTVVIDLDIQVTETVNLQVGVDGAMVFDGTLGSGTSRSWSAKDTLYVRIENPKGATISVNGNTKLFAARNFAETKIVERQFSINDRGTLVSETPLPPLVKTNATPANTPTPLPSATPTLTPSTTPTARPTTTRISTNTPTATSTPTLMPAETPTETATPTPSGTPASEDATTTPTVTPGS